MKQMTDENRDNRKHKYLRNWKVIMLVISLGFFGVCAVVLGQYYRQSIREKQTMNSFKNELAKEAEVRLSQEVTEGQETSEEVSNTEDEKAMLQLQLSWAENADVAAWLTIPGTQIDYPLMYTPAVPDYYLHRDVKKQEAASGTPYLDERCDLANGERLIAYGHNMKDGSMFADLLSYEKEDYEKEHSRIRLVMPEGIREYEVVDAFRLQAQAGIDLLDYEIDQEGPLLLLCTCEYSLTDGRFVLVGQLVT